MIRPKQPRVAVPDLDITDSLEPGDARLLAGKPTEDELAAVTAVLAVLFEAGVGLDRPRDEVVRLSPWERSQRHLQGGGGAGDPFGGRFRR
ncbi:hypothetical protein EG850_07190 [Gulosibacter macacae]|uniref:Acyl-CoA carboxylase subunit epsilon n=1 Tax=Gulosibacter macacae TaxID=2488791 RepID=A0A3P3VXM4_9MICO|nr:acyl-CoA carboxylase epsilon subunit [Gulosibacter macacae]RRJ86798.1 hypothetical protein EG850_07190 [Gulosibacter macacae]